MNVKDKIKNQVKEKKELFQAKILDHVESIKKEMRKKFTIAWLFLLGALLIFQGIVRLFPKVVEVPEYIGFFIMGGIVLSVAVIYGFVGRK